MTEQAGLSENDWVTTMPTLQIDLPFPYRVNRHLDEVRDRHGQWAQRMGLLASPGAVKAHTDADFPALVALTHPQQDIDADGLTLLADAWFLTACLDDLALRCADSPVALRRYRDRYLSLPVAHAELDPISLAWQDAWQRQSAGRGTEWREHTLESWRDMIAANADEVECAWNSRIATFEDVLALRTRAIGRELMPDLAEAAAGRETPRHVADAWLMRRMLDICAEVVRYMNEVFSFDKEIADGEANNLVSLLERDQRLNHEQALTEISRRVAGLLAEFGECERQVDAFCAELELTSEHAATVRWRVDVLRSIIRGSHDWSLTTGRYKVSAGHGT